MEKLQVCSKNYSKDWDKVKHAKEDENQSQWDRIRVQALACMQSLLVQCPTLHMDPRALAADWRIQDPGLRPEHWVEWHKGKKGGKGMTSCWTVRGLTPSYQLLFW